MNKYSPASSNYYDFHLLKLVIFSSETRARCIFLCTCTSSFSHSFERKKWLSTKHTGGMPQASNMICVIFFGLSLQKVGFKKISFSLAINQTCVHCCPTLEYCLWGQLEKIWIGPFCAFLKGTVLQKSVRVFDLGW
jgi:hypothetical protein